MSATPIVRLDPRLQPRPEVAVVAPSGAGGPDAPEQTGNRDRPSTIPAKQWIDHLVAHVALARAGSDPEGPHQIRVSLARLRVWLELGGWRVLGDDLRWLRVRAATVRDLDVHLAQEPPPDVLRTLQQERAQAQGDLLRALDHPRLAGLIRALAVLPPLERRTAERGTARLARRALRRGRHAFDPSEDLAALHALRRAIRRVRFGLEWLGRCPRRVIHLQDALGEVGDKVVALRQLDRVGEEDPSAEEYRQRLRHDLVRGVRRARRQWGRTCEVLEDVARWKSS
jgi:CHAD domain-containing protein